MPFGRDTHVATSNIILDGALVPYRKGEGKIWMVELPVTAVSQPS